MDERLRTETTYLQPVPDPRTVENKIIECASQTGNCSHNARKYRTDHMYPHQHRGHIDGIATHPRNRPIIIGRGDPEHTFQLMPRVVVAQVKRQRLHFKFRASDFLWLFVNGAS